MKLFTNHLSIKNEMLTLLNGIDTELDATLSNNNRAINALEVDRASGGWCKLLYSNEAEELWIKQLKITPDDPEILHHVAILHHARAFDYELSNHSSKADSDWNKAWDIWSKIIAKDDFWDRFSALLKNLDIDSFKEKLIEKIITMHFEFAYSPDTPINRSKFHLNLALKSGIPNETIDGIRKNIYEKMTNNFPDEIWVGSVSDISILNQACLKIKNVLDIDNGCMPALFDIIRIQYRILEYFAQEKHEHQDNNKMTKELHTKINETANKWYPYFKLCTTKKDQIEFDINENIITWLRFMGNIKYENHELENALKFYENASCLNFDDQDLKKNTIETIPIFHSMYARELAESKSESATLECEKALKRSHHSPTSYFILALAYQTLSKFEQAIEMCKKGIELTASDEDESCTEKSDKIMLKERLSDLLGSLEINKSIQNALKAIKQEDFEKAIEILSSAIEINSGIFTLYFFRCQCYMKLKIKKEVANDLEKLKKLAQEEEEKKAVKKLQEQFETIDIDLYINKAIVAIKDNEFNKAVLYLNEAIGKKLENSFIYQIRFKCHMELDNLKKAEYDIKKAIQLAISDEDKKQVQKMKENFFLKPLNKKQISQTATKLLENYKSGLPDGVIFNENYCLEELKKLIKDESKDWKVSSINNITKNFMENASNNFSDYCIKIGRLFKI